MQVASWMVELKGGSKEKEGYSTTRRTHPQQ